MKMTSSFDIHVFGDGLGETILLEFQNKKFGIVDFGYKNFITWFDKHIEEAKIEEIEFLLWTHPHDDHTRYLSNLLTYLRDKNIKIKNFFCFPFEKIRQLSYLIDLGIEPKYDVITNSIDIFSNKVTPKYLTSLYEQISKLKKSGFIAYIDKIKYMSELYDVDVLQKKLSIHCIAPVQDDIDKYKDIFQKVIEKKYPTQDLYPDSNKHNIISTAIHIKFGNSNIILGGDVEKNSWTQIMKNPRSQNHSCCNLLFLKSPHHGSENAYSEENWDNWGNDFHTAITPYNKSNLPTINGLENLLKHTTKIYILKDSHKNLLLGEESQFATSGIKQQEDITTSDKVTSHIKFTIFETGEITHTWL